VKVLLKPAEMVRVYSKKTDRVANDAENIRAAINSVGNPIKKSFAAVARDFSLTTSTLKRHYQKAITAGLADYVPLAGVNHRQVFNKEQETLLEDFFITCADLHHGLTHSEARKFAFHFAFHNKISMPNSWAINKTAGVDWLHNFLKVHQRLSVRVTENVSIARVKGFTKENIAKFFNSLEVLCRKYKYPAKSIWNVDESSVSTVGRASKVIGKKGVKAVGKTSSQERGSSVTFCVFVSAGGESINPSFIFPRVKTDPNMIKGAHKNTVVICNGSGWNNKTTFSEMMQRFIRTTNATPENRQLLLLDSHESHFSVEIIELARENGVDMLTFPPHCTHKLQPLDVSCFGPFKTYMNNALHAQLDLNINVKITIQAIPGLAKIPYERAFTVNNIQSGFKRTGEKKIA
jgi:DDE superfamily endonuclease